MSIKDQLELSLKKPEPKKAPPQAEGRREVGIARASMGKEELVQTARRIARTMAANGPVTIEDVCDEMAKQGYPVWAGSKENPQNWKGSVFNVPEFVCVGNLPSRKETNNGRHVRQWALKSWLHANSLNGSGSSLSAFDFIRIYNDYMHEHQDALLDGLVWLVGTDFLQSNFAASVSNGKLFGVDVRAFPGVGALLLAKKEVPECVSTT